jgi:hypothetical protein
MCCIDRLKPQPEADIRSVYKNDDYYSVITYRERCYLYYPLSLKGGVFSKYGRLV